MNTFLIVSFDKEKRDAWITQFVNERNIDALDMITLKTEGSIGIEDVRNVQKRLLLKPLKSKEKIAVIVNAHELTIEAQNALLKILEEPPENTFLILSAEHDDTFLPTVLSRTSVIGMQEIKQFAEKDLESVAEQVKNIKTESFGGRLKQAETLATNKQEAILWIEKAIYSARQIMLEEPNKSQLITLERLMETYKILKTTNVNTRFTLENLFLKF